MKLKMLAAAILTAALAAAAIPAQAGKEPDRVLVQHILIGFKGKVPNKDITRTKKEAKVLVDQLLVLADEGGDFDALVEEYTDDQVPGILPITNTGAPRRADARPRGQFVPSFGDVAFRLEVGEIGVAKYHATLSPYGWHIIKRLE